jgi:hypothetical protein
MDGAMKIEIYFIQQRDKHRSTRTSNEKNLTVFLVKSLLPPTAFIIDEPRTCVELSFS